MPTTPKPRLAVTSTVFRTYERAFLDDARAVCWGHRTNESAEERARQQFLTFAVTLHPPAQHPSGRDAMAVACVYDQAHTCFAALMQDDRIRLLHRLRAMLHLPSGARGYFVEGVAVNPAHRGQRLCQRLMRRVLREAKRVLSHHRNSYVYLTVEVPHASLSPDAPQVVSANAARRCYEKAGFRVLQDAHADEDTDSVGAIVPVADHGHVRRAYAMARRVETQPVARHRRHQERKRKTLRRFKISRHTRHTSSA